MTDKKKNNQQKQTNDPYQPVEFNPNDTEFGMENPAVNNQLEALQQRDDQNNKTLQEQTTEERQQSEGGQKSAVPYQTKEDGRGGNNNPSGASGYTSGRVDDRGRKSLGGQANEERNTSNDPDPDMDSAEDIGRIPNMPLSTNAGTSDGQVHLSQKSMAQDNGQPYGEDVGKIGADNRGFDTEPQVGKDNSNDAKGGA